MNYKLIKKHKKNCTALRHVQEGIWNSPWFIIEEHTWGRANSPTSSGWRYWIWFRCSSNDCPAKIAVKEDFILKNIPSNPK